MKDTARFLKALADETRLQMLWLLFHHRELCVCDLVAALGVPQSKASRHLATLRHAGLVTDRREAAWSYYSLRSADRPLERALLATLRARLGERPDADRPLRALDAWLVEKERGRACAAARQRSAAPRPGATRARPAPARRARARRAGGGR